MVVLQTGDEVTAVDAQCLDLPDILQIPAPTEVGDQKQVATDIVDEQFETVVLTEQTLVVVEGEAVRECLDGEGGLFLAYAVVYLLENGVVFQEGVGALVVGE